MKSSAGNGRALNVAGWTIVLALVAGVAWASGPVAVVTYEEFQALEARVSALEESTTEPTEPPTTEPSTSSTTEPPTTTTEPPTTTSSVPVTSTTMAPPSGDDFDLIFKAEGAEGKPMFTLARLPYDRLVMPGHGWTDGNRQGYRCAYTPAIHPSTDQAYVVATAARPAEATYGMVNDSGMSDGTERWWDGTRVPAGTPRETGECPGTTEPYLPYAGEDRDVRVEIWHNRGPGAVPHPVEVREYGDYVDLGNAGDRGKLEFVSHVTDAFTVTSGTGRTHTVYERLTLIFHFEVEAGSGEFLPVVVYYLDVVNPEYDLVVFP